MRHSFLNKILITGCFCALFACAQAKPLIKAAPGQTKRVWKTGETPSATFSVTENGAPLKSGKVFLQVDLDGGRTIHTGEIELNEKNQGTITVTGHTLKEPGFLRMSLSMKENGKTTASRLISFAFEPEKILPAEPCPADFRTWWKNQLQEAEKLPLDPKLEKLPAFSSQTSTAYKISFAAPGGRVWGFLTIPAGPGPFPALIKIPGAGPGEDRPLPEKPGVIQMLLNVHDFDPLQPDRSIMESYKAAEKAHGRGYHYVGKDDRNTFFFRRVILGFSRAVDYLAKRSDVRKNGIGVYGFSQGGAMTLILAGINPNVSFAVANMPAMCDLFGMDKGRGSGWPYTLIAYKRTPGTEMTARYYDAANFAAGIRIPVVVVAGGIDDTSRPTGVYAAFNSIPSKEKTIFLLPDSRHSEGKVYHDAVRKMETELKKR